MKNAILITLCWVLGIVVMPAQTTQMSSDDLIFRKGIEQFLKEEGFIPTIDSEDNSINFKKEGERFWIVLKKYDANSSTYIEIHKSGFGIENTNHNNLIEACNKATADTRCAKAYVTQSSVSFTVEMYCYSIEEFKYVFYKALGALDAVKTKTKDNYNELDS